MAVNIIGIEKNSLADKNGLLIGDELISINGNEIFDILDLQYYSSEKNLELLINRKGENENLIIVKDDEYQTLGFEFDTYLIDKHHFCKNKCIFCFIDQLPKGMRKSLYFKDDDERLSFLFGNYITLTNLSQREIDRIKLMKISPINISVHSTDEEMRVRMMKNPNAKNINKLMNEFKSAGITMNAQIVLCKGFNDKEVLEKTINDLQNLYPNLQSVAIVPLGVTRYRENLEQIEIFTKEDCREIIKKVHNLTRDFEEKNGHKIVHLSDEFFLKAEMEIPNAEYYEDFAQLENGVGMVRNFLDGFFDELEYAPEPKEIINADIVTGMAMYPIMLEVVEKLKEIYPNKINIKIHGIKNDFFGGNVWVTGLIVGEDLIKQLKGELVSDSLYLCEDMLRSEKDLFLDDKTPADIEKELNIKTVFYKNDGIALAQKLFNIDF